jgi:hypothetical protein
MFSMRIVGNVGAPATVGGREKERDEEKFG